MDLIETTPKMELVIQDIEHVVEALRDDHALYSPLFQRREQREAAHSYLQGVLATVSPLMSGHILEGVSHVLDLCRLQVTGYGMTSIIVLNSPERRRGYSGASVDESPQGGDYGTRRCPS